MRDGPAKETTLQGPLAVRTRALVKRFGRTTALAGVDLTVPEGAVYVLVGSNGAGKTTLLKVLLDLVVADSGDAQVLGLDTRRDGPRARACIGWVPERDDAAYGWMRVDRLLAYHAAFHPRWDAAYAAELAHLFDLQPGARFGRLSKGHQRRVRLLMALAHRPPVLLMDEPTDGLDPVMRERVRGALAGHLARFPTTVLVSTHLVAEADRLCDHLGVMRAGRIEVQVPRDILRRRLLEYRFEVGEGWVEGPALAGRVVRRGKARRERAWTLWGEEADVLERLRGAGATVRQVRPLLLEEAAQALLWEESDDGAGAGAEPVPAPAGI